MSKPHIRTLLIANRGEIACRIAATAQDLGMRTIALYSDADRDALHVKACDLAVHIGPSPAAESYLRSDAILDIAEDHGADAIHPGYGFLSENPAFARACADRDIIFIGPSADAMEAMALKGTAKALMEAANVPVVPGYHGEDQSDALLKQEAEKIGYPILIKAVAGGGGKGMRRVESESEFDSALQSARHEAEASFANADVLLEKLITRPRHIEIQIFGDSHGNVVHLWERDCSIQRRHQKVLEEAPAPDMPQALRSAMGAAAVRAAEAISYVGAGTVEFIVDASKPLAEAEFYFMEMNTRLQVEHPVSEMISGQDFVAWQLLVAQGHPLPFAQEEMDQHMRGHAIEARLYAEDAFNGFLPSTGKVTLFQPHRPLPDFQRIDSGVAAGDTVSVFYDPMIAKMIAHGPDRTSAINALIDLLASSPVAGLKHNRDFLIGALDHQNFRNGDVHTGFIEAHEQDLTSAPVAISRDYAIAALALINLRQYNTLKNSPWASDSFKLNLDAAETFSFQTADGPISVSVVHAPNGLKITCNGDNFAAHILPDSSTEALSLTIGGQSVRRAIYRHGQKLTIIDDRRTLTFYLEDPTSAGDDMLDGPGAIIAPMPGKIISVCVTNDQHVSKGDALLVMEAMKMEQTLTAARAGVVSGLSVSQGDQVKDGRTLLTIIDPQTSS